MAQKPAHEWDLLGKVREFAFLFFFPPRNEYMKQVESVLPLWQENHHLWSSAAADDLIVGVLDLGYECIPWMIEHKKISIM